MSADGELLTVAEVAADLRIHRQTVARYIREGALGHVRIGRRYFVTPAQRDRFIAEHTIDAEDS